MPVPVNMPTSLIDMRENILLRIMDLLRSITDFKQVYRNRANIPNEDPETKLPNLPCAVLLDGKEVPLTLLGRATGRGVSASQMTLLPQVFIILMPRSDVSNEGVGEELSALRIKVLKVILKDDFLLNLLGPNGQMEYRGHETDLQTGSFIEGQMQIDIALTYTFNPDDL